MASSTHNPQHQQHFQEQRAQQASDREDARKSFGTNSPPLEATGSARPMGMASVHGDVDAEYVLDGEQRKAYFRPEEGDRLGGMSEGVVGGVEGERAPEKKEKPNKMGQSLAMQMDERT